MGVLDNYCSRGSQTVFQLINKVFGDFVAGENILHSYINIFCKNQFALESDFHIFTSSGGRPADKAARLLPGVSHAQTALTFIIRYYVSSFKTSYITAFAAKSQKIIFPEIAASRKRMP